MEDALIATKLRMLFMRSYSSTIFGDQFMSRINQAISKRQCKESMTIVYDTIRPGEL